MYTLKEGPHLDVWSWIYKALGGLQPLQLAMPAVAMLSSCYSDGIEYTFILTYTVVHKKRDTFIFSITLANIDGFS